MQTLIKKLEAQASVLAVDAIKGGTSDKAKNTLTTARPCEDCTVQQGDLPKKEILKKINPLAEALNLAEQDELDSDWRRESAKFAPVLRAQHARIAELEVLLAAALHEATPDFPYYSPDDKEEKEVCQAPNRTV